MQVSFLNKICTTSLRNFDKNETYQRELNSYRIEQINKFLDREKGIMPPAVVLNSLSKLRIEGDYLDIDEEEDSFFVIDGQHRIKGAMKHGDSSFEFPVIIMDSVDKSFQDELFISINNEQKKVNPTVRFRIMANNYAMTPERVVLYIATIFNEDVNSPFCDLLVMNDKPFKKIKSTLSLSAFASMITYYIYDSRDYYIFKDILQANGCVDAVNGVLDSFDEKYKGKKIFWTLYKTDKWHIIAKMLMNYFNALKTIFGDKWSDKNYILTKTTGYNAFMLLFEDVFNYCSRHDNNFSYKFMHDLLSNLSLANIDITGSDAGVGKAASMSLYRLLYKIVFNKEAVIYDYCFIDNLIDDEDIFNIKL